MAAGLRTELDPAVDESLIWLALDRLEKAHLLQRRLERAGGKPTYSRREVARRLGLAGSLMVLLPVLTSITAPTPLHAQTPAGGSQQPGPSPLGPCLPPDSRRPNLGLWRVGGCD
jgi:hypothetical protein